MANRNKLYFGLGVFALVLMVVLLISVMGHYERSKRGEREQTYRDRFAQLEEQIAAETLDALERLPMMYKERVQPFDSVARSKIREITGRRAVFGVEPSLLFASMIFDDDFDWDTTPLFFVEVKRNKEWLGVENIDSRASLGQIRNSQKLMAGLNEARDNSQKGLVSVADNEVFRLFGESHQAQQRFADLLLFVPPSPDQLRSETPDFQDWHLVDELATTGHDPAKAKKLKDAFKALKKSWTARDNEAIVAAVGEMKGAMTEMGAKLLPSDDDVALEIKFNQVKPFNYASWLFFATAVFGLFSLAFSMRALRGLALGVGTLGFALMGWGFYVRTSLGFGVSITNLYESMVAVAALGMLVAVVVDFFRGSAWTTTFAGLGSFVVLQVVDLNSVKFSDGIGGTIAVLANNIWVHIHVPIVMLAYACYFIAFLMAIVGLPWVLAADRKGSSPDLKGLLKSSAISINIGTAFMFAGLILGGIWAYDSWGRFWGWDPKETWALILFLFYMVVVHGRFTKWLNPFWTFWMLFLGGNVLLWTYYGTNELLSGLHSYANSAGEAGFWDNFVHERNRWFVWSTIIMGVISLGSLAWYVATGGAATGAPEKVADRNDGVVEPG